MRATTRARLLLAAGLTLAATGGLPAATAAEERPNILLVETKERPDWLR